MKTSMNKKPDFLDDVVDEMGSDDAASEYGAEMEDDGDGPDSETDDETVQEDRMMAAGQLMKALGVPAANRQKVADALKAFVATCM